MQNPPSYPASSSYRCYPSNVTNPQSADTSSLLSSSTQLSPNQFPNYAYCYQPSTSNVFPNTLSAPTSSFCDYSPHHSTYQCHTVMPNAQIACTDFLRSNSAPNTAVTTTIYNRHNFNHYYDMNDVSSRQPIYEWMLEKDKERKRNDNTQKRHSTPTITLNSGTTITFSIYYG
ncbi:unnamed protein product [Anisakis simplex]|uniref:Homeobox protein araucan n=1 Tax=Anisakis simplex TaxID=6269 RepID=A0A0M3K882_ANISI|nr:unnamed protein product [Anisakis simplex]